MRPNPLPRLVLRVQETGQAFCAALPEGPLRPFGLALADVDQNDLDVPVFEAALELRPPGKMFQAAAAPLGPEDDDGGISAFLPDRASTVLNGVHLQAEVVHFQAGVPEHPLDTERFPLPLPDPLDSGRRDENQHDGNFAGKQRDFMR